MNNTFSQRLNSYLFVLCMVVLFFPLLISSTYIKRKSQKPQENTFEVYHCQCGYTVFNAVKDTNNQQLICPACEKTVYRKEAKEVL
jgi:hypothetical protein